MRVALKDDKQAPKPVWRKESEFSDHFFEQPPRALQYKLFEERRSMRELRAAFFCRHLDFQGRSGSGDMKKTSLINALAQDIAAGLRDGLSLQDAAGFAWATHPRASWGELSRARSVRLNSGTESQLAYLARLAALELSGGASEEQAAAAIWSLGPELSARPAKSSHAPCKKTPWHRLISFSR
ncbi:hypothetical protein [Thiohalophilus sp.]|uniref:hypothetical protein n=1 Tax=Thiohalophilus sp. TaxID=3028392 RepID=UPI002ACDF5F2|nr:hypothetical protein [Thiohalophilus sp.]MDZ7804304.1 hypothetical protein [Thiohalophilus sp.]